MTDSADPLAGDDTDPDEPVWVYGAGGHGKVVIATLRAAGRVVAGIVDDDPERRGTRVLDVEVVGSGPGSLSAADLPPGAPMVLALGGNRVRRAAAERLEGRVRWATAIHPSAVVAPGVEIGGGTVVFAGAILQPDTRLGRHVVVNTSASCDHDGRLGDFSFLGPGGHLSGDVTLDQGAFLGVGASVIPGCRIGAWATVGAGAVVVRDVEPGTTVIGVPARRC